VYIEAQAVCASAEPYLTVARRLPPAGMEFERLERGPRSQPVATRPSLMSDIVQLIEQPPRRDQIGRLEPLHEAVVDGLE
jgi:hypothetical protein